MANDPLPDHVVVLAVTACIGLTFALAFRVGSARSNWYFEQRRGPVPTPYRQAPILMLGLRP